VSDPLLRLERVSKRFGGVTALRDVSLEVHPARVTCLLGDNGAGKSTLIQVLAGVHQPTSGRYLVDGIPVVFGSPRDARSRGIATVHQDLALVPLMSVWRNFVLGAEPVRLDRRTCLRLTAEGLGRLGIDLRDLDRPVGTLSGGERQAVAIARAIHFGARVLILDEPTAALGVRQTAAVLRHIGRAREQGVAVLLVTHNPMHAHPIGDRFILLRHGEVQADLMRADVALEDLVSMMGGVEERNT
jgi:simple sugar transport system ATP-binding protein